LIKLTCLAIVVKLYQNAKLKKVNDYNLGTVFSENIPDIYLPFLSIFEYKIYPNPSLAEYHLSQGLGKNIKIA